MELKTLQIFSSVLRHRSFTHAADELHMSVSAVSRSIARLEETLGLPLFDRDRRGMRPTGAAAELSRVAGHGVGLARVAAHTQQQCLVEW